MWPVGVAMHQVLPDDRLQVAPAQDEDPVETFPAEGAHEALDDSLTVYPGVAAQSVVVAFSSAA